MKYYYINKNSSFSTLRLILKEMRITIWDSKDFRYLNVRKDSVHSKLLEVLFK